MRTEQFMENFQSDCVCMSVCMYYTCFDKIIDNTWNFLECDCNPPPLFRNLDVS